MTGNATAYDAVQYPTAIFPRTHPERLAVLATLHGLNPPDVKTARVLEIACGDGMNLIAFAAAYPDAHFFGFDLAPTPIARGNALIEKAGLQNVSLEVLDILDAANRIEAGSFDYIIAHGVYAWIPTDVADAMLALVSHALSPDGVAFVSYNAMPGGHLRFMMRDMLLHELDGVDDPSDRVGFALEVLEQFKEERPGDDVVIKAVRAQAEAMLNRPRAQLFHDELGPCFYPKSVAEVAAAGASYGLRFLSDTGRNRQLDGFLPDDMPEPEDAEAQIIRQAQSGDYASVRFFRQTVFVRAECAPIRHPDPALVDRLWATARLTRNEEGVFKSAADEFEIHDEGFANVLLAISAAWPSRVPVSELLANDDQRITMMRLFSEWIITLYSGEAPYAVTLPERPMISRLIRAQIALGSDTICTLDHRFMNLTQPEMRAMFMLVDGTRTAEEIKAAEPLLAEIDVDQALHAAMAQAMVMRG